MKQGEMVLVHLSDEQLQGLKGNKLSPMPAIVVSVWENEYVSHPICKTGVNVRVFTDSGDAPLWLTSLPMIYPNARAIFGDKCALYEPIRKEQKDSTTFERTMSADELRRPKEVDGVPRRIRLDLNTPAELAIRNAMHEVEKAGADLKLTEAIVLLDKARALVADYVEQ